MTVILFLSIYMTAFCEFHQLLRIPFMVQHFQKHISIDPSMSFRRFIEVPYLGPIIAGDDLVAKARFVIS